MSQIETREQIIPHERGLALVELADVPDAGVSRPDPNARSGNPRHDIRSGKFGDKPGGPTPPPNTDPLEFARFLDAVRDAAREFDTPDIGDIRDFLAGRARNPAQVDAEGFLRAVIEQRVNDVVDMLDTALRRDGILPRGRRRVMLRAPRGYLKRTLNQMDPAILAQIEHRLIAMGHNEKDVDTFLRGRVPEEKANQKEEVKKTFQASEEWLDQAVRVAMVERPEKNDVELAASVAKSIAENLPQPVVNVNPVINVVPKPMRRELIRDPETGLATSIRDVPEEG